MMANVDILVFQVTGNPSKSIRETENAYRNSEST